MAVLSEQETEAMEAFVACDANDPAKVARIQSTVRLLRAFTSGQIKDGVMEEIKRQNAGR